MCERWQLEMTPCRTGHEDREDCGPWSGGRRGLVLGPAGVMGQRG